MRFHHLSELKPPPKRSGATIADVVPETKDEIYMARAICGPYHPKGLLRKEANRFRESG
jgi:hypothetical protein